MQINNTKYRLKFKKYSRIRFIGHLDLLNVFQLAINRANLPIAYSQGFNPHQQMSFAQPLSLGFESTGEYIDLEFAKNIEPNEVMIELNKVLPEGLLISDIREFKVGEKSGASLIERASYEVTLSADIEISEEDIIEFMKMKEIIITKKGKKKTTEVDIRPDIFELKSNDGKIDMLISAGSTKNIKAEAVVEQLYKHIGREFIPHKVKYKRTEMYKSNGEGYGNLLDC